MNDQKKFWRLLPLLAAVALSAGATSSSCSINSGDDEDGDGELSFATELELRHENGERGDVFEAGEPIDLLLRVRNRLDSAVEVEFETTRTYDFVVVRENTEAVLWQWSNSRSEDPTDTTLEFERGETRTFEVTWDQLDDLGVPVPRGVYEARGALVYEGFDRNPMRPNQLGSAPVRFVID